MSKEIDVIVYGTICLDLLWRVEKLPPPGGYVEILEEKKAIGGEAANTAIALSKWGIRTVLVGNPIGSDADGELLQQLFGRDAPQLDISHVEFATSAQTPYCVCMSTPDGQRTMFGHRFADLTCTPLDTELARTARFFTVEPNAYDCGVRAVRVADHSGAIVVPMDYARDPAVNDVATVSVTSSEHVGRSLSEQELTGFAVSVRKRHACTTIVTMGERGCVVVPGKLCTGDAPASGEPIRFPAFVAPQVVDTTGCGDIFRAGLLFGLCKGLELMSAVEFASAAAALNCSEMGGWGGVRSVDEIYAFIRTANRHPL